MERRGAGNRCVSEGDLGKSIFRGFLGIFVSLYRLTGGRFGGSMQGLSVLLLTTTGAKTGKVRTVPLGYFEADGPPVIIGSNAGADTHPGWYFNLKRNPRATVEIGDKRLDMSAQIAEQARRDQLWARLVELSPAYGNYAKKTSRVIPLVELLPVMSQA